jgi:hypothetical protein
MTKLKLLACATIAAFGAAACASSDDRDNNRASTAPATQSSNAGAAQTYSDAQVQGFVAARQEIQALTPGTTADAQAANQSRISQILQSHNLAPDVYNAIASAAQTDQTLANRIAAASVGTSFTDAQLQAFATASAEIDPITRSLATATPEQRDQAAVQIRAILARNNITFDAYNGIAAQAQSDDQLAARIAALSAAQPQSETGEGPATEPDSAPTTP